MESLTVFGDGDSKDGGLDEGKGGSVKPLIQLLDQHNFKKVVERNGLKDAVVCVEEIDGSFRTADEVLSSVPFFIYKNYCRWSLKLTPFFILRLLDEQK